jgi:exodeoxyribonuclease VII large subunit
VAELGRTIKRALDDDFRLPVWVEGEISGARPAASGHVYFTLKDSKEDASVDVAMYKSSLTPRGRTFIKDGNHVRLRGKPQFWAPRGRLQLICDAVELAGAGALLLALEKLKAKLAAEGIFAEDRKRPLPHAPRRIGVVTSAQGAVIHDIAKVAFQRGGASILLAPALVQGAGAARSVLMAIAALEKLPDVDVIIVGRGGGSADDLQAFNDEELVRKVASCRVPIVSAVGHEVDVTLVDFAADARAATPSQAAEMTVPDVRAEVRILREQEMRLRRLMTGRSAAERHELSLLLRRMPDPVRYVGDLRQHIDDLKEEVSAHTEARLRKERTLVDGLEKRIERRHPRVVLARERADLFQKRTRMETRVARRVAQERSDLTGLFGRLDAMSPLKVLGRGYSIATHTDGRAVRSATEVTPGETIRVRVHEGAFLADVTKVLPGKKDGE